MWLFSDNERQEKILKELELKIWDSQGTSKIDGVLLDFLTNQPTHAPKIAVYLVKNGEKMYLGKLFGTALCEYCDCTNFVEMARHKFERYLAQTLNIPSGMQVFFTKRMMQSAIHYSTEF